MFNILTKKELFSSGRRIFASILLVFTLLLLSGVNSAFALENAICSTSDEETPKEIPDFNQDNPEPLSDSITVNNPGMITDLDIYLNVEHGAVGELEITLTHVETNKTINLINISECTEQNIEGLILDDEATVSVNGFCGVPPDAAISGELSPVGILGNFKDEDVEGQWTLTISDTKNVNSTPGILKEWCLITESTCGNNIVELGEDCDDGNEVDGDGCSATCSSECGNGDLDPGEECDDGNNVDGDGCSAACTIECGNT